MTELLYILENISLPIIILISAGFLFQKIFRTDTGAVSKIVLYLFTPVTVFVYLYKSEITLDFFALLFLFMLMLQGAMFIVGAALSAVMKYNRSTRGAVINAMVFMNTGNYGFPLIALVFQSNAVTAASQVFIVARQNLTSFTFGVFQASSGQSVPRKKALGSVVRMPAIYAVLLAAALNLSGIKIPGFIRVPMEYISSAFIAVALAALGMQLAEVKLNSRLKDLFIVSAVKVAAVPLAAFGIITILGVKGILAPALLIGVSTPTAVNTALLAREFGNEPDFAAQIVLLTTLICTFSLPFIIYFAKTYFGF